jgi:hypothetical protein
MDDYFSSDFTDEELQKRLHHVSTLFRPLNVGLRRQVLVVFSGLDEYVPSDIDGEQLLKRLVQAMTGGQDQEATAVTGLYLKDANHNLSSGGSDEFVQAVAALLTDMA